MSFQPVIPISGLAGWRFLQRTLDSQQAAFARAPEIARDTTYFRENIGKIDSAEALVADRRLLRVALGAFGLDADLPNRAFIRRVLGDGTLDPGALSNRLADKRYREMSAAFGFGDFPIPRSKISDFGDRIATAFETRQFEIAVGEQDTGLRLSLGLARDLGAIAARNTSETARWLTVLGNPPLREVFETAFGLPRGFGALDLDRQVEVLRTRTRALTGNDGVAQFTNPDRIDALNRQFLIRSQLASGPAATAPGAIAVQLLQAAARRRF